MRTKQIIKGLNNSQKFRFILTSNDGTDFGMTMTIGQMATQFATREAQTAVFTALEKLAIMRRKADDQKSAPIGLGYAGVPGFRQIQVDLH